MLCSQSCSSEWRNLNSHPGLEHPQLASQGPCPAGWNQPVRGALCLGSVASLGSGPRMSVTLCCPRVATPGPGIIPSSSSTCYPCTRPVCGLFHGSSGSKSHQKAYMKRVHGHPVFLTGHWKLEAVDGQTSLRVARLGPGEAFGLLGLEPPS